MPISPSEKAADLRGWVDLLALQSLSLSPFLQSSGAYGA